jgi:serine/threonine protein kinase
MFKGFHDGTEFLVMEYFDGEDMSKIRNHIRQASPTMPLIPSIYLTIQMLKCIKSLHKHGYVHRDIKPSNFVRISRTSTEFRIIDFGVAKLVSESLYQQ